MTKRFVVQRSDGKFWNKTLVWPWLDDIEKASIYDDEFDIPKAGLIPIHAVPVLVTVIRA